MAKRLSVVVSQSQSQNPKKRALEEEIIAGLLGERGIDVAVVPHLYDLRPSGTGMLCLSGIAGDLVVCSWLYPRAAFWTLDRHGIRGKFGTTLIKAFGEEEEEEDEDDIREEDAAEEEEKERVAQQRSMPNRSIFCLDLRVHAAAAPYLEEMRRISREANTETVALMNWIDGSPKPEQVRRYLNADGNGNGEPTAGGNGNGAHRSDNGGGNGEAPVQASPSDESGDLPQVIAEDAPRRWYPVIDFSRCTNCLECIDFCLFGVYGIDAAETILVEQPDNCRKGCPACSRVCPENAIIFPQHKTPIIAGSPEVGGSLKIDLSKLFGAPDPGAPGAEKAVDVAVQERDEQLMLAGREAVGATVGIPKRQQDRKAEPKDDLDVLIDRLDDLDL